MDNQVPKRRRRREEEGEERRGERGGGEEKEERERGERGERGEEREKEKEEREDKRKKQGRGKEGATYGQVPHYHGERVVVDGTELSSARVTRPTKRVLRGRGRTFMSLWCYMFIAHIHVHMYMDWGLIVDLLTWATLSLVPRPSPSFSSLAVQLSGSISIPGVS